MRKRILFRKTICSLLALLLAFSSLMVLPVLAEGEVSNSDSSSSETASSDADIGSSSDSGSGGGGSSSEEPDSKSGSDSNVTADSEPDSTTGETDSTETSEPAGEDKSKDGDEQETSADESRTEGDTKPSEDETATGEGEESKDEPAAGNETVTEPADATVLDPEDQPEPEKTAEEVIPEEGDHEQEMLPKEEELSEEEKLLDEEEIPEQEKLPEEELVPEEELIEPMMIEELPPYSGINIDGSFDDWAGVAKTDVRNPNWDCTFQSAVVWDGDYVYIYFCVYDKNAVTLGGLGPNGNGRFGITTDLGAVLMVRPIINRDAKTICVEGIDNAKIAIDNYEYLWNDPNGSHSVEIAIPTSRLPDYKDSIDFGFYLVEPFLSNIRNLNPVKEEPEEPSVFACDGTFGEWRGLPRTEIQYDGSGIQHTELDVDGYLQLYCVGSTLYGHVRTTHPDHLEERGSEFLAAVTIAFNGDREYKDLPEKGNFYPKMVKTDGRTTVNEGTLNPDGITTYLISDTRETTAEPGPFFGTMKVSVSDTVNEMEFEIDLEKVADYIGCDASDFKKIEAQFGRIGQEWAETAGTPTGPILGLALCFATVGGVYAKDRKKKKK